ncbi:MAG: hypothetical protein E6Q97_08180 [Desulfurellales bacterium]|nr:MAG: hypothetical protein E6Q97_08180 [Desulfurellales bacterium]
MALVVEATESGAGAYISSVTPTTAYTNAQGAGKGVKVTKAVIKNVTGAAVTAKAYKVPSGGSISGTDWLVWEDTIDANGQANPATLRGLLLDNGDSLRFLAGTASALRYDLSLLKES